MNLESHIQQWVSLDNQLKLLNEKTRELREKRNNLEEQITRHAANANSAIKISDGRLKLVDTRVPEPLTFKYLEKTLGEIIKNESHVKTIVEHIKKRRSVKVIHEIKRYYDN